MTRIKRHRAALRPLSESLDGAPWAVSNTRQSSKWVESKRTPSIKTYGRVGPLEVRLARTIQDIRLAQQLRYEVFYEEMSAEPNEIAKMRRRDEDAFDSICDHLLVVDLDGGKNSGNIWTPSRRSPVVGTYRVLRQEVAERHQGFYTQSEYDIAPLIAARSPQYRFMELGRSCVLKPYRNKRSVALLWHGLWTYIREHRVDVMIGCASFPGTDLDVHAEALSFLHHNAQAPPKWHCKAHDHLYQSMNRMPKEDIDIRSALKAVPPLIKGYLRLGAFIGDGAVIDHQFDTTDVLIILPVEEIDPRYFDRFGTPEEQKSRISE